MEPIEKAIAHLFTSIAFVSEENDCPLIESCVYFVASSTVINGVLMFGHMKFADNEVLRTDFVLNMESVYAELVALMTTAAEAWEWDWTAPEPILGP